MSYLQFQELPKNPNKKTLVINVIAKGNLLLGQIKWMPTWRKYTFWTGESIYDAQCLQEVISELNTRNEQHKLIQASENKAAPLPE